MSNVDIIKDTRRSKADISNDQCGFQELVMTSDDRVRLLRKSTEAYYESLELVKHRTIRKKVCSASLKIRQYAMCIENP